MHEMFVAIATYNENLDKMILPNFQYFIATVTKMKASNFLWYNILLSYK